MQKKCIFFSETIPLNVSGGSKNKSENETKSGEKKSEQEAENQAPDEDFENLLKLAEQAVKKSKKLGKKYKKLKESFRKSSSGDHTTDENLEDGEITNSGKKLRQINVENVKNEDQKSPSSSPSPPAKSSKSKKRKHSSDSGKEQEKLQSIDNFVKSIRNSHPEIAPAPNISVKSEQEEKPKKPDLFHSCEFDTSILCQKCVHFKFFGRIEKAKFRETMNYEHEFDMEVSSEIYQYLKTNRVVMKIFETRKTSQFKILDEFVRFTNPVIKNEPRGYLQNIAGIQIQFHSKHLPM